MQTPIFPHKNAIYTSITAFFCEKIWWFEKFVVILHAFSQKKQAQVAELVDALVSNTSGKPCRFDPGPGYDVRRET